MSHDSGHLATRSLGTVAADGAKRTRGFRAAGIRARVFLVLAAIVAGTARLSATDYYLSPRGDDSSSGRDPEHAWKSWKKVANSTVLRPGNRVRLLDGTYATADVGSLSVDCSQGTGESGTAASPVVIEAVHERRAFLKGDGSARVLWFKNCSYYRVEGLHVESADNPRFPAAHGIVEFEGRPSDPALGIVVRRNLIARNNRYGNSHLVQLAFTRGALIEENELYDFHRLGLLLYHSEQAVVRRNYANSRGYPDLPNGRISGVKGGGDEGFSCYPCSSAIVENNISEGNGDGFTVNASAPSTGNVFFGNISIAEAEGFRPNSRGDDVSKMPVDTRLRDNVVVDAKSIAVHNRAAKNTDLDHMSLFPAGASAQGLAANCYAPGHRGDGDYRFMLRNSVVVGTPVALFGINVETPVKYGNLAWSMDRVFAFGSRTNFFPRLGDSHITNSAESDPGFGACRLWCPDGAQCKGKASDAGDLGATVLYRYENGRLTNQPLWNPSTGAFLGAGALVEGVNDKAGASLFDVHTRLNVNQNGCRFPDGYPSGAPRASSSAEPQPTP
jgi:hypothetical protein